MTKGSPPDRPDQTGPGTNSMGADNSGLPRGSDDQSRNALAFAARLVTEVVTVASLTDLLAHVIRLLHEEMGLASCGIALIDDQDPDLLTVRATSGLQARARGQSFRRGSGLGWASIESAEPLIIPDLHADSRALFQIAGRRSGIFVPLFVHGQPTGVITAYAAEVDAFSMAELNLFKIVGSYLAGTIEMARLHEQLKALASTDSLTGLVNRRVFLDRLRSEIDRSRRAGEPLSVALLDLDRFKHVNDTYGHASGDELLIRISRVLRAGIRGYDLAGRFGGDEFTILFPGTTRLEAEEVLGRIPGFDCVPKGGGESLSVGWSWGIASFPEDGEDDGRLLKVADQHLYEMKNRRPTGPRDGAPRPPQPSMSPSNPGA